MQVIRANCRIRFTDQDVRYLLSVLDPDGSQEASLLELLFDEATRDCLLDADALYQALIEDVQCLQISLSFYFYVLVRHVLREAGIHDCEVADYVAAVLTQYAEIQRNRKKLGETTPTVPYLVPILAALKQADDRSAFEMRAHLGNQLLVLTGIFREHLQRRRDRKAAPELEYYESIGQSSFRAASCHHLARAYDLSNVLDTLADRFQEACGALNELTTRLLFLQSSGDDLLRRMGLLKVT